MVQGRVKRISSILSKAEKKNVSSDAGFDELAHKLMDIAGVRVVCRFEEDISRVVSLLRQRDGLDMTILDERDYISNIKKSGYRSYHIHIKYTVSMRDGPRDVVAEIQIRTMAMNIWASTEHSLKYKYKGELPNELKTRLFKSAEAAFLMDREMDIVRDEIIEARRLMRRKQELGDEILRNIKSLYHQNPSENIYALGLEFYKLNKDHNLESLNTFNNKLKTMAKQYGGESV
jgi:putative GTP pyrophosphokinase